MAIQIWYHAHCNDGLCAAAITLQALQLEQEIKCLPVKYGESMPPVKVGDEIWIVDFSYPHAMIAELATIAKSVVVLDHHQTAFMELAKPFSSEVDVRVEFDMRESGASLAWRWFYADKVSCDRCAGTGNDPGWETEAGRVEGTVCQKCKGMKQKYVYRKEEPLFVSLIKDRDLWLFKHGDTTKSLHAALSVVPPVVEDWIEFLNASEETIGLMANDGLVILDYKKMIVERAVEGAWMQEIEIESSDRTEKYNYLVPIVMATDCISEIGEALCFAHPESPFSMTYRDSVNKDVLLRTFSLRSGKKGTASESFDCSVVASWFKGGGHRFACGFVKEIGPIL